MDRYFRLPDQIQTCTPEACIRDQKRGRSVIGQHQHPPYHFHHPDGPLMHHGGLPVLPLQQQGTVDNTDLLTIRKLTS